MFERFPCLLPALVSVVMALGQVTEAEGTSKRLIHVGEVFPDMSFNVPDSPGDRVYLGLESGDTFTLKDIQGDLVLVEILNVHCIHCQEQASIYNELYKMIEQDASTRGRIKFIGFAVGNNEFEVKYFRRKYDVPFPIISDHRFELHRAIGGSVTPFSIFVRLGKDPKTTMVGRTHQGVNEDYIRLFEDMQALMTLDLAAIRQRGKETEVVVVSVEPPMPESELMTRVREAMAEGSKSLTGFERVELGDSRNVYTGIVEQDGQRQRLFAQVVSRPTICDVCHDVHFFYIFNEEGKLLQFVPLQLTKYGNEDWSEEDVERMRRRLVGRYIFRSFFFEPEVDAVSTATISSVVIFDGMAQGKSLFDGLKEKGYIE
jgi:peroxiredoxin